MITTALRAARSAGDLIVSATQRLDKIRIDEKGQNDFVSDIDRAAEREIISHLHKAYPNHRILAEESGYVGNPQSDHLWIIDPLDGTTNYLAGIPHYAVSIACHVKGRAEHAVVYDPEKREEFTASRGGGAFLNGKRLKVSGRRDKNGALFATGIPFSTRSTAHMEPFLQVMSSLAKDSAGVRRMGAAALDLAYVAASRFDAFWEMYLGPWDIAAGVLLVQEAGGTVSDFNGGNAYLESGHIVAATPELFDSTLRVVRQHLGYLQTQVTTE